MKATDISPEAVEKRALILESLDTGGVVKNSMPDTGAQQLRALRSALTASAKQIELLEARVRQVDVEIAQARVSTDAWKGKLERERADWSAFAERLGFIKQWAEHCND